MINLAACILPWALALANRMRGSDPWYVSGGGKALFIVLVGILMYFKGGWGAAAVVAGGYFIGQSLGWGKYVGAIIVFTETRINGVNPWDNGALQKSFKQEPGGFFSQTIHYITNLFFDHNREYERHCLFALMLRGVYWWVLMIIGLILIGVIRYVSGIIALLCLSICFPVSVMIGALISWDLDADNILMISAWALSEYVYGFIQGIVFLVLWMV